MTDQNNVTALAGEGFVGIRLGAEAVRAVQMASARMRVAIAAEREARRALDTALQALYATLPDGWRTDFGVADDSLTIRFDGVLKGGELRPRSSDADHPF